MNFETASIQPECDKFPDYQEINTLVERSYDLTRAGYTAENTVNPTLVVDPAELTQVMAETYEVDPAELPQAIAITYEDANDPNSDPVGDDVRYNLKCNVLEGSRIVAASFDVGDTFSTTLQATYENGDRVHYELMHAILEDMPRATISYLHRGEEDGISSKPPQGKMTIDDMRVVERALDSVVNTKHHHTQ